MSRRSEPPLKLFRSPLIFVLAQVKITPVMSIGNKIQGIQEAFRRGGYPRLTQREVQTTHHRADGSVQQTEVRQQWEFINKEKTASALVDSEGITFQVTQYELFEDFVDLLQHALALFSKEVQPNLLLRTGLRYVDLVIPAEGKSIKDYFTSGLRGFHVQQEETRRAFFTESVSEISSGSTFVHRYIEAASGFGFPPDLLPVHLQLPKDPKMRSTFGLLDLDHFSSHDEDFSVESAIEHFWQLHEHQTLAFKASVTDEALTEWKDQ